MRFTRPAIVRSRLLQQPTSAAVASSARHRRLQYLETVLTADASVSLAARRRTRYHPPHMQTTDYFRIVDLNPTIGAVAAPVAQALDPRALHMFGFVAAGQEIRNLSNFRVFVSFDYDYAQGGMPALPTAPGDLKIHAVLDPMGGAVLPYTENHERAHALVWLDPAAAPAQGVPVEVRVRAWR